MIIPKETEAHEEPQEQAIAAVPKKQAISIAAAERAARDAGFTLIDAKALKAAGTFGQFLSEVGAIHIGRSRLAMNMARIEKALDFCEKAAEGSSDPELTLGLVKVSSDLIGKSNSAAELLIKSAQQAAETAKTEAMIQLPGFVPGQRVGPMTQVNVTVAGQQADPEVSVEELNEAT